MNLFPFDLDDSSAGGRVIYVHQTQSTNDDAFTLLRAHDPCLVWSLDQVAGRGSRGRSWSTPSGKGLALSIGLSTATGPKPRDFCYPLFAGLLLIESMRRLWPDNQFRLKWPNDILLAGRKLAGILCESRIGKGQPRIVMGMGLNLKWHPILDTLPKPAAALSEIDDQPEAERLVMDVWQALPDAMVRYADQPRLQDEWLRHSHLRTDDVLRVQADGQVWQGRFAGLDVDGAMLLALADGEVQAIRQSCEDFALLSTGDRSGRIC